MSVLLKRQALLFYFCLAVLLGTSYNTYLSFERFKNPDSETYLNIAQGNFKDQSLVRRYRVIVPAIANAVAQPIAFVYWKIWTEKRGADYWPLLLSFYLVNSVIFALAGVLIFELCLLMGAGVMGSFLALVALLAGGRWQSIIAGHPITDSLYLLSIALFIYAIYSKSEHWFLLSILIGPLAKESFIFFIPLVLLYAVAKRSKTVITLAAAYGIYFAIKYFIDQQSQTQLASSIQTDLSTFNDIFYSLKRLFSVKGFGEMFTLYGLFTFLLLLPLLLKDYRQKLKASLTPFHLLFAFIILVHMLLSTEVSRMLFFGSPLWIPLMAINVTYLYKQNFFKSLLPNGL